MLADEMRMIAEQNVRDDIVKRIFDNCVKRIKMCAEDGRIYCEVRKETRHE